MIITVHRNTGDHQNTRTHWQLPEHTFIYYFCIINVPFYARLVDLLADTVQSAQPYYVSFSLANEERINFLASSALFPRSFHALSTIISRLSHATNPTATRNVKFACHSIVPRSPCATGKIASRYTLQPIATCLHFILDQYRIRSSDPNVFTRVR